MKPSTIRSSSALAALVITFGFAAAAAAQTPNIGQSANRDCSPRDILGSGGELYCVKLDGGPRNDWQVDLSAKGGDRIGLSAGDVAGDAWQVLSGNFTRPESGSNVVYTILTYPNGEVSIDSGDLSTGFNFMGSVRVQVAGDSTDLPGNAGVDIARGRGATYTADLGMGPVVFPQGTSSGAILLAFAPLLDLHDVDDGGCTWGGAAADPESGNGLFIGFNVFRVLDDGSPPPTIAEAMAPENFVYFVDLFDAPGDDLSSLRDPDGVPYTGDEVVVFTDYRREPNGSLRTVGTAPELGRSYWYAYQPVIAGEIVDFANVSLASRPAADYRVDSSGDGTADSVDLDEALGNGLEFYSPQADYGLPGLGLTNGGVGLCFSDLLWATLDPLDPNGPGTLPAAGAASLEALRDGDSIRLRIHAGLEEADLLGFVAYRLDGRRRVRLHEDPLVARGGTGNTYEVLDERQGRRGGAYEVDVLLRSGEVAETLGPVRVRGGLHEPQARRAER